MGEQNQVTTNEIMDFLKTNMVVKEEFLEFKSEMSVFRTETESGFSNLYLELKSIKDALKNLEQRTKEDADVTVEELLNLKKRVARLEKELHLQAV